MQPVRDPLEELNTWTEQRLLEAEQAEALAAALDARAAELAEADETRAQWYAHTAETRAAADRARAELTAREAAGEIGPDEPRVSAQEWLKASNAAARTEDPHRNITAEHEITDLEAQRDHDHRDTRAAVETAHHTGPGVEPEPAPVDIRQQAERDPEDDEQHEGDQDAGAGAPVDEEQPVARRARRDSARAKVQDEDTVRVPSADETAESVHRAQRALAEVRQREAIEEQRANDEARDDELARWHSDDTGAATSSATNSTASTSATSARSSESDDTGPVLDRAR